MLTFTLRYAGDPYFVNATNSPITNQVITIVARERNLCFLYRFRDVFSRFRCCVYNGTGPLFVHVKHNGNIELHVSARFQKYGNM